MSSPPLAMRAPESTEDDAIADLLGHRFGDGLVYLREDAEHAVLERAVRRGLVTREGYLTPAGRSLLARLNLD